MGFKTERHDIFVRGSHEKYQGISRVDRDGLFESLLFGTAGPHGDYSGFLDGIDFFHVDSKDHGSCFALSFGVGRLRGLQTSS